MTLSLVIVNSGCNIASAIGVLATPGAYERTERPEYDLQAQQERKVMLWVECPRSSGADYEVQKELTEAYERYITGMMELEPENLIVYDSAEVTDLFQDPKEIARSKGAGYVLMVQLTDFEMTPLQAKDYFYGIIETRSLLMDVDLGVPVWPPASSGTKAAGIEIELDTKGRKSMMKRLTDAAAHCTLRYLYPCLSVNFKHPDERLTIQEAAEMETF